LTYKVKGKVHPGTGHECPEGEQRYRSTLSLTSTPDGAGGQLLAPAVLPPEGTRYPLYRRMCGPLKAGLDGCGKSCRYWEFDPRTVHPPSFLYNGYRIFPGGKVRPGRAADHSPPSSAAVMEE